MPTLEDVLKFLSILPTTTTLLALILAGCAMVTTRDWRLLIFSMTLYYVLTGILLTRVIRSDIAMIKTLVGATICVTLYITARRSSQGSTTLPWGGTKPPGQEHPSDDKPRPPLRLHMESGWPFRLLVAILGVAVAANAATRLSLPSTPPDITLACFILFSQGLLTLSLTDEPLKGGLGVLAVIAGFDLFYSGVVQSLIVVGLLGLVNFSIALAIAYLTTLQANAPLEGAGL